MKNLTIYGIIVGFIIILGIGIGEQCYLTKISEGLLKDVTEVESLFLTGNLNETEDKLQNVINYWKKQEKVLEVIVNHEKVNRISETLIEIEGKIKNFFASNNISSNFAVLKEYIKNIYEENKFTINNVL